MPNGQFIQGPRGNSYKLKLDGRFYEVNEWLHQGATTPAYSVSVHFDRITSNVFGNGSKHVEQSCRRQLPRNGPRWMYIRDIYLSRKRTGRL